MSGIVYSTESGEIDIGVCFCSDMDEEPQSTDQERRYGGGRRKGGRASRGKRGKEGEERR